MYHIELDDLTRSSVLALLEDHLEQMAGTAPPESRHALDLSGLKQPNVQFYSLWSEGQCAGCGALKKHDDLLGELKSMKTHSAFLRKGVGRSMLAHLIAVARDQGLQVLKLETGSMDYFRPAHELYRQFGFVECTPFANYQPDENSLFMSLDLV